MAQRMVVFSVGEDYDEKQKNKLRRLLLNGITRELKIPDTRIELIRHSSYFVPSDTNEFRDKSLEMILSEAKNSGASFIAIDFDYEMAFELAEIVRKEKKIKIIVCTLDHAYFLNPL